MRLVIAAALTAAGPIGAIPATAQSVQIALRPGEVLLQVDGDGEYKSRPDLMSLTAGVVTTGRTAREALQANSALANTLVDAARRGGVQPGDVRTAELSVNPQFEELDDKAAERAENEGREPRILGYIAANKLELRLRDLTKAPDIIDAMFAAGANSVKGPSFSLSDPKPAEREARKAAVMAALDEAETYAEAVGMKVGRILRIGERGDFETEGFNQIVVAGSRINRTPIEPGELTTRITVWIDYALVPK